MNYQGKLGKIGMDSSEGWVATVDGSSGFAFVQGFSFHAGQDYPDETSVQYWTNGVGKIFAWGRTMEMPADIVENPHVVETEVVGPYAKLSPRRRVFVRLRVASLFNWGTHPVLNCTEIGCTLRPSGQFECKVGFIVCLGDSAYSTAESHVSCPATPRAW